MKRKSFFIAVPAVWLALSSCGGRLPQPAAPSSSGLSGVSVSAAGSVQTVYDREAAADSASAFAFRFFARVAAARPEGNLMLSPLSAGMALGMVAEGAAGETRAELLRALGFGTLGAEALHAYYGSLAAALVQADSVSVVNIAGSAWADRRLALRPAYIEALVRDYGAQTGSVDFADRRTADVINAWASDHTAGRIPKVVDELSPSMRLLLLNAVCFKGLWAKSFDRDATREEPFLTARGDEVSVPMMNRRASLFYSRASGFEAVELPYKGDAYSMILLLPEKGKTLAEAVAALDAAGWPQLRHSFEMADIRLKLPRFEARYSRVLNADLGVLGVRRMFSEAEADLSGIGDGPLSVGMVKQDTYVRVDEEGTEAAAVTTVGIRLTGYRPHELRQFYCNRPFVYVICERTTGAVLFVGRMEQP